LGRNRLRIDVFELGISIWVVRAFISLAIGLAREPKFHELLATVSALIGCPISVSAAASLSMLFDTQIILAPIDGRAREPSDLGDNFESASTSGPHLDRRKQPPPPLIELRANRLPALPNRVCVDHATDLRWFATTGNPYNLSHSVA
jgi:hypothetical protein